MSVLVLVAGLVMLIAGGELLVRGASALAAGLRVAPVVVGMTVVAFGTSAPELVVNLAAAVRGESAIGFGNIVGSNTANIGLLLGITAVAFPLTVHRTVIRREIPMMLLASAAAVVLGMDGLTGGAPDVFARGDGVVLLLLFCVFLYYTLSEAMGQRGGAEVSGAEHGAGLGDGQAAGPGAGLVRPAVMVGVGLALLAAGGVLTVQGGSGLARALGAPEVVIGLTLVAVGTSLPELATCIVAARRGHADMAVGNIVGSNIFNLLFIWGLTATVAPAELPIGGRVDLAVMTLFAAAMLAIAFMRRRVSRADGGLLLLAYAGYVGWLVVR